MARRRHMTAKQRRYFGKRTKRVYAASVPRKRRVYRIARRYGRARSYARRGIGGFKGMLAPVLGGVADSYTDSWLPISGVGSTVTGMFLHNETVKTIGLYQVGHSLGSILPLPGRGAVSSQGGFK